MSILKKSRKDSLPARRRFGNPMKQSPETPQDSIFQRNRTLTRGSYPFTRSNVSEGGDNQSSRVHTHKLALIRRRVGIILISVLLFAVLIFWLLTQFTANVTINMSDSTAIHAVENKPYVDSINTYFGSHPISRLRFALNINDLTSYLATDKPEVASVKNISSNAIGNTNIEISMRQPLASWTINGTQYFVDALGIAFQKNYFSNPPLQIIDNSGVAPEQGATVASNHFLGFVGRIVALCKEKNYIVEQAIIPVGTTRQLEVHLRGIASHVLFSIDRPAGEQVEDMAGALKYLSDHGQSPARIDVRVSGKAFYL